MGGGGGGGGGGCNRVHLHIVFVLLYVLCVCRSVGVLSCVRHSIFYVCVTCCDLDVTISESERRREGVTTTSRMYHPKEKKK